MQIAELTAKKSNMQFTDDAKIKLKDLFVESKKGSDKSGGPEYKLMREAVGQLMTNENVDENLQKIALALCNILNILPTRVKNICAC